MAEGHLALLDGLAQTLVRVSAAPAPPQVAEALVQAMVASHDARTARIYAARDSLLVPYASSGQSDLGPAHQLTGFSLAAQAFHEGEVLASPADASPGPWQVCVPLRSAGRPVGVAAIEGTGHDQWEALEIAAFDAIGYALGMWLTHPDSGLPSAHPLDRVVLSPRQLQVLALAASGRKNAAIAVALGYSESTVKQEMRRIMKQLGVVNRTAAVHRAIELGLMEAKRT